MANFFLASEMYPSSAKLDAEVSLTAFQAHMALTDAGVIGTVEALINHPDTPEKVRIGWRTLTTYKRDNPLILGVAAQLGWSEQYVDDLFVAGALISPDEL